MRHSTGIIVLALAFAPHASALQTTRPATTSSTTTMPAGAVALKANVTSVKGNVQVRDSDAAKWEPAKVGMQLDQGAEIRTGLRSAIQIVISGDQTITLDRLGTVTVLQAYQTGGKATTDIGMKYGRTRYDINAVDLKHESTIRSPGSTLAIRGTDVTYEDQAPWVPTATSREGRAQFRNFKRQFVAFGGKSHANVAADKGGPAEVAISNTRADPRGAFAGRTDSEDEQNVTLTSLGGADAQGVRAVLRGARAGGLTGAVFSGVPDVPGPLEFDLSWISLTPDNPAASNLDLRVTDPHGQTASAQNPTIGTGSATGSHLGDDLGLTGSGAENVVWGAFFPAGKYTVSTTHAGGADAQVFIDVFKGDSAEPLKSFGRDPQSPIVLKDGETLTETVTVKGGGVAGAASAKSQHRAAAAAAKQAAKRR